MILLTIQTAQGVKFCLARSHISKEYQGNTELLAFFFLPDYNHSLRGGRGKKKKLQDDLGTKYREGFASNSLCMKKKKKTVQMK